MALSGFFRGVEKFMRNDKKMKKLNIIKWLTVFLVLHIMATGCAHSGVRDPFAKEWVSKAEYQERLETKYRPWYQSLSEAEKAMFHQTLDKRIDVGMAQMKLGAQMMQGGPIY